MEHVCASHSEPVENTTTLMVHLTGRCNLECSHCYMEGSPRRTEMLSTEWVVNALRSCRPLGAGTLFLTGGEPTLHAGLDGILDVAADAGMNTTLCTNGTLLGDDRIGRLAAMGATVQVSLDGIGSAHDVFRGRSGAYSATTASLYRLAEAGISTTLVSTVTRRSLLGVRAVVEVAARAGVRTFRAQPLLRLGRGNGIQADRLDPGELDHLLLLLADLARAHHPAMEVKVVGQTRRFLLAHPCGAYVCNGSGCHRRVAREIKRIIVRENGLILPEATNLDARYAMGRVDDGPLADTVLRFLQDGYGRFDALCRAAWSEVLPDWPAAVVPWDEILAERSRWWEPAPATVAATECGSCAAPA